MNPTDYFDTSALVKRYLTETGSAWVRQRCAERQRTIAIISLGQLEVTAAAAGRLRGKSITQPEFDHMHTIWLTDFQYDYNVTQLVPAHITTGIELVMRHRLRGYDAVHLACALLLNAALLAQQLPALTFVSADQDLLNAAQIEGLMTDNPNLYS